MEVKTRINELRKKITTYDTAYYGNGESIIPDKEYDEYYHELVKLEKLHPEFYSPDSPTQRVGNDLTKEFKKIAHDTPMMSIDNTYSEKELTEWIERLKKLLPNDSISFIGELKIDGIALSLIYENGKLLRAVTRGNGEIGDEVTANVRTIRSIPLTVEILTSFEVRGEAFMSYESFNNLNKLLTENNGQKPMQNPRNTTAGTLKLQNPQEVASRHLSFAAYSMLAQDQSSSHQNDLETLKHLGFQCVQHSQKLTTTREIIDFCMKWEFDRHSLPFPADGVVIKVNEHQLRAKAGTTAKSPRWVIAYKYPPERKITRLEAIDAQVGRTGVVTPIARLSPTLLAGTTIQNASLHNYDEIERLGIRIGDYVEIEKGGEIIPKIIKTILDKRPADSTVFIPPDTCPSCGSLLSKLDGEVALRCYNVTCKAQQLASIEHFVSRSAMDIRKVGPALIDHLVNSNLISDVADLYTITKDDLIGIERMGEKSALNVIESIENSKNNSLDKLIHGLGIRMIGAQSAKVLSQRIESIEELFTMSIDKLCTIDSIGPTIAESIRYFFDRKENIHLIERLKSAGVNTTGTASIEVTGPFSKKTFVLTGTLNDFSRESATQEIENRGGKVTSSVSKKTDYVLVGTDPGSKYEKATKLNIRIITESEFKELIKSPH